MITPGLRGPSDIAAECSERHVRISHLLAQHGLDALLVRRSSTFAWATGGGRSYINTATDGGEASLLYTERGRFLVTSNIEAARIEDEEGLAAGGFQTLEHAWHQPQRRLSAALEGLRVGSDVPGPGLVDIGGALSGLRAALTPPEQTRFRNLGRECAAAMDGAAATVRPGQTEYQIASLLARALVERGVWPVVLQVAVDERAHSYRHALPTDRKLERYALLSFCGRAHGLVCSITRLLHFGRIPAELVQHHDATIAVDAAMITASRPGVLLQEVFARAVEAYAARGYPDEWKKHHQGGIAGYEPREALATPESTFVIREGQALAYNPSVTGTKSEDTCLATLAGPEVLTQTEHWPLASTMAGDITVQRPAIRRMD